MKPWNNLWADLSQGMANSQMEPWNNLWADLSQGMANSQIEPWNNLWADLSQGMANSQIEPWNFNARKTQESRGKNQMKNFHMTCSKFYSFSQYIVLFYILFPFSPQKGELIKIIKKHEDGSWFGELNNKTGKFPFNYVQLVPPDDRSNGL